MASDFGFRDASGANLHGVGYYDTTLVDSGTNVNNWLRYPHPCTAATGYCGAYVVRFVIANRGAATQTIAVGTRNDYPIAGSNYTSSALLAYFNGLVAADFTPNPGASVAWNTGAAARVVPDAFYLRLPFFNNRIRISAMVAKRMS